MEFLQNKFIFIFLIMTNVNFVFDKISFEGIKTWSPDLLYEYANYKYLSQNNKNESFNINYMLLDPENYLKNGNISKIQDKMKLIYDKYNISTYIILISHLEIIENIDSTEFNYEVKRFASYFNFILHKNYENFKDDMSITTVFFIKEHKMRMRTGYSVKSIISDQDALDILKKRRTNLRSEKYYDVVNDLLFDIYKVYYEYYDNLLDKRKDILLFFGVLIMIIITFCIIYLLIKNDSKKTQYHYQKKESLIKKKEKKEEKVKEFLNKNKDKEIKAIFNDSCVICLEEFQKEIESSENNDIKKEEEKTKVLECGHKFHEKCINEWMKKQNKCPICRNEQKYGKDENKVVIEQDNNFFQFLLNIQIDYPNERTVNNNIVEPLFNTIRSNFFSRFVFHSGNSGRATENNFFNRTSSSGNSFGGGGGATAGW